MLQPAGVLLCHEDMRTAASCSLLILAVLRIFGSAKAAFRPPFRPVVKVAIDKSLGLALCLLADIYQILRIHRLALPPLIFSTFKIHIPYI